MIFSDGVSYLDIADNYVRADWRDALNEYWSPLLSWILAIVFKLFHPAAYWQVSILHLINFAGFCASLAFFELFLAELLRYRPLSDSGLSAQAIRIGGYASLMIAGLWHITMGYVSPDMLTMAILIVIAWLQLRIETRASMPAYIAFGAALGLGFLARAAFAPVLPLYLGAMLMSRWLQRRTLLKPLLAAVGSVLLVCGPFVAALSIAKGHLTWGATGPPNYAWEVDGAPRSIHWQGQPPELGKPLHPTRKILNYPATYEFSYPVSGTYPPWYEPSYWYAGISPRFEWKRQLTILLETTPYLVVLSLLSPAVLPCLVSFAVGDRRVSLSGRGIFAYWFLGVPLLGYIALYALVFVDKRYVGGALVILWTCLSASVSIARPRLRRFADQGIGIICVIAIAVFAAARMRAAFVMTAADAIDHREAEWNLHWMVAEALRASGVKPGARIAFIGDSMGSEWARQLGARIVAEVPVTFERNEKLSRDVVLNHSQVEAFWHAPPDVRGRVLDAFRRAGASLVVAEMLPAGAESQGWRRLFGWKTPHLPNSGSQYDSLRFAGYLRIEP